MTRFRMAPLITIRQGYIVLLASQIGILMWETLCRKLPFYGDFKDTKQCVRSA